VSRLQWIDKEDEAINSAGEFIISARFQTFLEQAEPQCFADFLKFNPQNGKAYNTKVPLLPLINEFLMMCPDALKGQARENKECVMAVPKIWNCQFLHL
jgi:hypothetical protein